MLLAVVALVGVEDVVVLLLRRDVSCVLLRSEADSVMLLMGVVGCCAAFAIARDS